MGQYQYSSSGIPSGDSSSPPPIPPKKVRAREPDDSTPRRKPSLIGTLVSLVVAFVAGYLVYLWFFVRISVGPDEVLILLKKDGDTSLPDTQYVIPAAPDKNSPQYAAWEKQYGDCNGIMERPMKSGTYFAFSPFDYEREIVKVEVIPSDKIGLVIRKFGNSLPPGQVLADASLNQAGPLPVILQPGSYPEYSNPHAYEIKKVTPVTIEPGHRGVVTIMAGKPAANPNEYLVKPGEQGVQSVPEKEGLYFTNLYEKRIASINIQSQKLDMQGDEAISFPSADSFDIRMEGFVEWRLMESELPLRYVQYGEGGGLIEQMESRVILPYSRTFSRLVGSQYTARDFIAGDTKLKFQDEFETRLRDACKMEGIQILKASVRDIVPPNEIKTPINEREIAKQTILSYDQQILSEKSKADLAKQTETSVQNQRIGDANKQVVTMVTRAQQNANVAVTKANQELAVAKLNLEAAKKEAESRVAKGAADAAVIELNLKAEAEPLGRQVQAFGSGDAFAQYFFYQTVSPSIKSILSNTDGVFADIFKQFSVNGASTQKNGDK